MVLKNCGVLDDQCYKSGFVLYTLKALLFKRQPFHICMITQVLKAFNHI